MEWGAMPVSIGLAGVYAAVMVAWDVYRSRPQATAALPLDAAEPRVLPASVSSRTAVEPSAVVLEQSA